MGACCSKPLDPIPQQHYLPPNPPMIYAQNHPLAPNRTLAPASVYQPNSNTYSPHVPMYVPPPSPPPISIPTRMFPQDPIEPQRRNMTQVVLGIDFGTTESGFAYCRRPSPGEAINVAEMITTNHQWPHVQGKLKTNTALEYDANWIVVKWGYPALAQRNAVKPKAGQPIQRPVELFKLHLGDMKDEDKPYLPPGLHYKQAITDYLREFGRLAMNTLNRTWPHLNFHEHVQIVMTVPAEFNDNTKAILRSCAHGAGLINTEDSENLAFTTEPEAAAIYCLNMVNQYPIQEQEPFMIVDCGGGTVDLTTRTLLPEGKLSEITVRSGEFCGSTYVDRQFLMWLSRQLGIATMKTISQNHYASLQYVVQEFFVRKVKVPFTGDPTEFVPIFLDIEDEFPAAMQYVTPKLRPILEAQQWRIQLDFDTVKKMFDPVVSGIISLIEAQLEASAPQQCQAIFLVGGFSESPYLYNCVREKFASQVPTICVAQQPIAAVVRGAVLYGLNQETITTRMLKWTYGIECYREWNPNIDEQSRRTHDGRCKYFDLLAKRGTQVGVNQQFTGVYCTSYAHQTKVGFPVYVTTEDYATYCDGLRLLGQLEIDVPVDPHNYGKREIEFSLMFGQMEIKAAARILRTGFVCHTMLKFEQ